MATKIEMPKLSDTMTEGTLIKWLVKVGDEVEVGDVIAEVETDKATMEMEAFDDGIVTSILIAEGAKAPIGSTLAILTEDGEAPAEPSPASASAKEQPSLTPSSPVATSIAPDTTPAAMTENTGSRVKVSPLAKKIALTKGIDLANITGTGPGGRIVANDIESYTPSLASAATTSATPASNTVATALSPTYTSEDKIIPLSGMRKIIAERLLLSKQTIPHFYLHVEVDAAPLLQLRKQVNAQAEETHGNKYSINDFIVKALINASVKQPAVNSAFNGDSLVEYKNVGVSVAIAVEDGLVTPVVKNAQSKSLLQISSEIKDLATRAKAKKLKPNEFDGGTITISNLGAWGIESFDAIVNPPQAAILSVGGIADKPVVKGGEIVPGKVMNLGLSCDHRVIDGAVAATFLNEIKKLIEKPTLMLV